MGRTDHRAGARRAWTVRAAALLASALLAAGGAARACPDDRPLQLLVPFAPGGSVDATARLAAQGLAPRLGRTVVVVNAPGASGLIATRRLLAARPDGCTWLHGTPSNVVLMPLRNPHAGLRVTDVVPVARIGATDMLIVASRASGLADMAALEAAAHAAAADGAGVPPPLRAGHPGTQTMHALALAMLQTRLAARFTEVPYGGTGPLVIDLLAGRIDIAALARPVAQPLVDGGRVTALGIVRAADGSPVRGWSGFFAAPEVPEAARAQMRRAVDEWLADPAALRALAELGVEPGGATPAAFADEVSATEARLRAQLARGDGTPPPASAGR